MKYFFIILGLFCLIVLAIWGLIRNTPKFFRNLFSKTKVIYWHPVDWTIVDEHDIYE